MVTVSHVATHVCMQHHFRHAMMLETAACRPQQLGLLDHAMTQSKRSNLHAICEASNTRLILKAEACTATAVAIVRYSLSD